MVLAMTRHTKIVSLGFWLVMACSRNPDPSEIAGVLEVESTYAPENAAIKAPESTCPSDDPAALECYAKTRRYCATPLGGLICTRFLLADEIAATHNCALGPKIHLSCGDYDWILAPRPTASTPVLRTKY